MGWAPSRSLDTKIVAAGVGVSNVDVTNIAVCEQSVDDTLDVAISYVLLGAQSAAGALTGNCQTMMTKSLRNASAFIKARAWRKSAAKA